MPPSNDASSIPFPAATGAWGPADDLCETGRVLFRFRASTGELWAANFRQSEVSIDAAYAADIIAFIGGCDGHSYSTCLRFSGSLVFDRLAIRQRSGGDFLFTNDVKGIVAEDANGANADVEEAVEYLAQFIVVDLAAASGVSAPEEVEPPAHEYTASQFWLCIAGWIDRFRVQLSDRAAPGPRGNPRMVDSTWRPAPPASHRHCGRVRHRWERRAVSVHRDSASAKW